MVLNVYVADGTRLQKVLCSAPEAMPADPIWLDLLAPTAEEDALVEQKLCITVPTRDEMQEIEPSSRLYTENGAHYMTATLLSHAESDHPEASAVTFILVGKRLVTVRYAEPKSFDLFIARVQRPGSNALTGEAALVGLLEAVIDRAADILERLAGEIERISRDVFRATALRPDERRPFRDLLNDIGRRGDLDSKIGESLATLGLINIEQNTIIKIFSVAAVVFMPPTLIASIYGMNFRHMPELEWYFGYPLALGMLIASALVTYWLFKRRGWL